MMAFWPVHLFFGFRADEWEARLPLSPVTGEPFTADELRWGIAAMLRRLDEERP